MLCIFDEAEGRGAPQLFADGAASLLRQWALRSGIWKVAAGVAISALCFSGWAYSLKYSLDEAYRRGNPGHEAEARGRLAIEQKRRAALLGTLEPNILAQVPAPSAPSGWLIQPVEISNRIAALKRRWEAGNRAALDEFWQQAARAGTPLIEPAAGSPRNVVVTFVWRGDATARNVALLAPLEKEFGLPRSALQRLLDTDVWYRCWKMKDDFRFSYRFLPNPQSDETESEHNPPTLARLDPLNRHTIDMRFLEDSATPDKYSIASMPNAPTDFWAMEQANVPAGEARAYAIKSAVLGGERKIWVYTPPGYNQKLPQGYPLLVLFDGLAYQSIIPTPTILGNLIHAGRVPPTLAVMVHNPRESRVPDLLGNPGFADFVSGELIPWIRQNWNVTRDPQKSTVGGYSLGGSEAALIAMLHPELFGNVLSQSGSFQSGNGRDVKSEYLASQYRARAKLALRFFIEAGSLEDNSKQGLSLLAANRRFVEILKGKGYPVRYEEVDGTHDPAVWRDTLALALMALMK